MAFRKMGGFLDGGIFLGRFFAWTFSREKFLGVVVGIYCWTRGPRGGVQGGWGFFSG